MNIIKQLNSWRITQTCNRHCSILPCTFYSHLPLQSIIQICYIMYSCKFHIASGILFCKILLFELIQNKALVIKSQKKTREKRNQKWIFKQKDNKSSSYLCYPPAQSLLQKKTFYHTDMCNRARKSEQRIPQEEGREWEVYVGWFVCQISSE